MKNRERERERERGGGGGGGEEHSKRERGRRKTLRRVQELKLMFLECVEPKLYKS